MAAAGGVTALMLVNADTGKDLGPLRDGMVLNLATLPTRRLNVRAEITPDTRSVRFGLDGKTAYRIENHSPFSLAANDARGGYLAWTPTPGQHQVTATAFGQRKGQGNAGLSMAVVFAVSDDPPPPVIGPSPDPGESPGPIDLGPPPVIAPDPDPLPGPIDIGPPPPPTAGNWSLVFDDEFNAPPAASTWVSKLWGQTKVPGEAQTYSPSAVTTANGILSLTATNTPLSGRNYTSGMINTGGIPGQTPAGFSFIHGYVEARIKMAAGAGMWSAFWMLPTSNPDGSLHDDDGELDIVEFVGPDPTRGHVNAHRDHVQWGRSYETNLDLTQDFHTYGMDWQADHLTWFFDGAPIFTVTDLAAIPTVAEYLILNLTVGVPGSWPGAPNDSTSFPVSTQVDYVRVWQKSE